jgi:hypothetical protein
MNYFINKITKKAMLPMVAAMIAAPNFSCNKDLDEEVYSQISVDAFYKTSDQAQLALNAVYNQLWNDPYRDGQWVTLGDVTAGTLIGGGSANGSGDRSTVANEWTTYTWTSDAIELITAWNYFYTAINWDNTLLDKLSASTTIPTASKNRISGEAKFLRAHFYFMLVRFFGGVPLQLQGTSSIDQAMIPRNTADEVYAQIIKDLTESAAELSPYNAGDHTAGRATSAAATSLLAKVYLQQRKWDLAAAEAKKVIDMNAFGLFTDYENINNPDFKNGKEQIFSIQHGGAANSTSQLYQTRMIYLFGPPAQTVAGIGSVQFHTLKDLVIFQVRKDQFEATPYTYRKWWSVRDKMPYYYKNGVKTLVNDTVKMYAPFLTKFHRIDFGTGMLKEGVDYPLIRYADVLLTYAEALNESKGGPTAEAYDAINQIRRRARAVGTSFEQPASTYPDLTGLNKEQFTGALLDEYSREFIGEGHYRWDLLRHDKLISNAKALGITAAAAKHVLFPIPAIQLSRNPNLTQNEGY